MKNSLENLEKKLKFTEFGFTLIELLSIISILAIIALIATPIILNVINDSKLESNKISLNNYAAAVKKAMLLYNLQNEQDPKKFSDIEEFITYEGAEIQCDTAILYDNSNFYMERCKVNGKLVPDFSYGVFEADEEGVKIDIPQEMTPVIYKNGNWEIADTTKEWYSYNRQEWANVVILNDGVSSDPGTKIYPSGDKTNIKAMFVYIPRYSYTIGNTFGVQLTGGSVPSIETPGAIDIKFIGSSIKDLGTASYTGNVVSNWYTHPAFTFGAKELEGIWVGKFELSHTTLTSTEGNNLACVNENCEIADGLRVLPNVSSLRNNDVANFFYAIRSMGRNGNGFGIQNDVHLIKNSEWAAVAYLTQSKYGKYGNLNYEGINKEIYQNKSSKYITGLSNGTPSQESINTQCEYDNVKSNCGIGASTTGNITGIYDMSGGSWEIVMGALLDDNGNPKAGNTVNYNSGFKGILNTGGPKEDGADIPESKYYDGYILSDTNNKGHAFSETSNWYVDYEDYFAKTKPWMKRGGVHYIGDLPVTHAGIFAAYKITGGLTDNTSTRIVLVK